MQSFPGGRETESSMSSAGGKGYFRPAQEYVIVGLWANKMVPGCALEVVPISPSICVNLPLSCVF